MTARDRAERLHWLRGYLHECRARSERAAEQSADRAEAAQVAQDGITRALAEIDALLGDT